MRITCGIDWSEKHHDIALMNTDAMIVARARMSDDLTGYRRLTELLAEHAGVDGPTGIEIAIETDKGLLVAALVAAGFTLYPINPRAVARFRERHGQAGGKSDPGDSPSSSGRPGRRARYTRVSPDALTRWQARRDPHRRV